MLTDEQRGNWEDIKKYLPKYLTEQKQKELFAELSSFEDAKDKLYTSSLKIEEGLLQGDGLINIPFIILPEGTQKNTSIMILSNSCDADMENNRDLPSRITYAPIIKLSKVEHLLRTLGTGDKLEERISSQLETIRKQRKTDILYLPEGNNITEESVVFLDNICSCERDAFHEYSKENEQKLFSLSYFGHYLMLLKMSIHFTRFGEGACRIT